jgi:hypothetical protein
MYAQVLSRAKQVLAEHQVPLFEPNDQGRLRTDAAPRLVARVWWGRVPDSTILSVRVDIQLLEQARLVKDPGEVVWVPTWGRTGAGYGSPQELPSKLVGFVANYLREFGQLYRRAHA